MLYVKLNARSKKKHNEKINHNKYTIAENRICPFEVNPFYL